MPQFFSPLAGVSFRPAAIRDKILRLEIEQELFLTRQPENEFDENAIQVHDADADFLGFITRTVAEEIAPLLDAGQEYSCLVSGVNGHAVSLEIIFPDGVA